jgi:hypothetical protein
MGQQQLLLIILGVIIVGIAIAVGLSMFTAQSVNANRDAIISDITNMAANAYQYRIRPVSMGGGGGAYTGYSMPTSLASNENGSYVSSVGGANAITFTGTSAQAYGTVQGTYDGTGKLTGTFTFTGQFQ